MSAYKMLKMDQEQLIMASKYLQSLVAILRKHNIRYQDKQFI